MARTGRPKKIEHSVLVHLRFDADVVEELDEWVSEIRRTQLGGGGATRSDLIRDIIVRALDERRKASTKRH